ncbi:hypothetical protein CDAR_167741 [Caerostris darwini]|uniref:Uncharacterized protein n=1 Tax=Caerostris darwini TaxID=1538125 RepID=A0AAV4M9V2_9ARAC|nr:hypothetical protein CDAR_167741 [Caerostris darwini]
MVIPVPGTRMPTRRRTTKACHLHSINSTCGDAVGSFPSGILPNTPFCGHLKKVVSDAMRTVANSTCEGLRPEFGRTMNQWKSLASRIARVVLLLVPLIGKSAFGSCRVVEKEFICEFRLRNPLGRLEMSAINHTFRFC